MARLKNTFLRAIVAGFMIGIGGTSYLVSGNKYVGAVLFCIGLITICAFNLALYTGRVGYISKLKDIPAVATVWLGNLVGTALSAGLIYVAVPEVSEMSAQIAVSRFAQNIPQTAVLALFCGMLMYLAVELYKTGQDRKLVSWLGIFLCVPAFILCGFEHSIADMFYFAVGGKLLDAIPHLLLVTLGNGLGGILARIALTQIKEG